MKREVGIVGAGVAGLHLGLYLRKHGVDATIVTDRTPDDYVGAKLLNTVGHHFATIDRENYLGVNHWPDPKDYYYYHDHFFNFPEPLHFAGDFAKHGRAVDYRVYLPLLMQDFVDRGGNIEFRRIKDDEIGRLAARFDLLVVSSGRDALGQMFAYRPEHTPSLLRRSASRAHERDAFSIAGPWRNDCHSDAHFRRAQNGADHGECPGRRSR
jgi:cation diffusion facilitator CzcD-associated flavoprotein CzcO